MDGPVGHRRARAHRHRSRPRHVRRAQRSAVPRRLHRPLPRRRRSSATGASAPGAHGELARLASYGVSDRLFVVRRTWADLRFVDGDIDPSNRKVPLCYAGDPKHANSSVFGIGAVNTLRTWLSMWSLDDSPCSAAKHLPMVTLPALVVQADADSGVFPSDAAGIHDGLWARPTSSWSRSPVTTTSSSPDGARDELADTVAAWVARAQLRTFVPGGRRSGTASWTHEGHADRERALG